MKLKLDENLSRHLKPALAELGHDPSTVADENLLGAPDERVAAAAKREGRFLLTLDVAFADVRNHPPGSHPGIVLFRPGSYGPVGVQAFVETFVSSVDLNTLAGCVAVVEPSRLRIRRPANP